MLYYTHTHKGRLFFLLLFVSYLTSFPTWISNWNSKKIQKFLSVFFFKTTGANVLCQRWIAHVSQKQLTASSFFFPFLFVLQVLNRAHLSPPHSYSLLVDINNRPTLDFSFFFRGSFLFIYFRLVWLSHVVFLSLLFLVQRLPELTTMNRYIFLSVFIYIYI